MATLTIPVGGFRFADLLEALTQTQLSSSSTATTAVWTFSPNGPSGITLIGTGFTPDGNGGLSAGIITGIDYIGFEGTVLWSMRGLTSLNIASPAFQAASTALDAVPPNDGPMRALFQANTWNIQGSFTADEIIGGVGADTLRGGLGNDTLVGHQGNDLIVGGPHVGVLLNDLSLTDYDTVDYSKEAGTQAISVDMDLVSQQVTDTFGAKDTLKGVEFVIATTRVDTIKGGSVLT